MSEPFAIRMLDVEDATSLLSLRREALETEPLAFASSTDDDRGLSPEFTRDMLANRREQAVFGSFDGDTLTGMVGIYRESKTKRRHLGGIWGMYVTPSTRNQGIGRALLEAAIQQGREWGLDQVQLGVSDTALAAKHLYETTGFRAWGCEPCALRWEGRFVDEHHLTLDLRDSV